MLVFLLVLVFLFFFFRIFGRAILAYLLARFVMRQQKNANKNIFVDDQKREAKKHEGEVNIDYISSERDGNECDNESTLGDYVDFEEIEDKK